MTDTMTALDDARSEYSDFYKEVHGIRPRWAMSWSLADLEAAIADLHEEAKVVFAREAEREAAAIKGFEAYVTKLIAMGAGDRATALRWIHDAEDTDGDAEYLCFTLGLPYGYFNNN